MFRSTKWKKGSFFSKKVKLRKKNYRDQRFIKSSLFIFLGVLFLSILLYFSSSFFKIKQVNIKNANSSCVNEDIKNDINLKDRYIFFVDQSLLEQKIKSKFLCVKKLDIKKNFPSTLELQIEYRAPKAIVNLVKTASSSSQLGSSESSSSSKLSMDYLMNNYFIDDKKFIVDDSGFVFSEVKGSINLQQIDVIDQSLAMGQYAPVYLTNAIEIISFLQNNLITLEKIKIFSGKYLVVKTEQILIFNLDKGPKEQLASLQLILQKAKIDSKVIENIDLRFDKPIVIYSPKKANN